MKKGDATMLQFNQQQMQQRDDAENKVLDYLDVKKDQQQQPTLSNSGNVSGEAPVDQERKEITRMISDILDSRGVVQEPAKYFHQQHEKQHEKLDKQPQHALEPLSFLQRSVKESLRESLQAPNPPQNRHHHQDNPYHNQHQHHNMAQTTNVQPQHHSHQHQHHLQKPQKQVQEQKQQEQEAALGILSRTRLFQINPLVSHRFPNDGIVSVDEVILENSQHDLLIVPLASHRLLLNHPATQAAVIGFLKGEGIHGAEPLIKSPIRAALSSIVKN